MSETIITKTCRACKETKALAEFNKHPKMKDGHLNQCKLCRAKYMTEYYKTEKGKSVILNNQYCYHATKKGKAAILRAAQLSKIRHPEQIKAKDAVKYAIKVGKLPRANKLVCHYCGNQAREYHHHKGYAPQHRLDVIQICSSCHKKQHSLVKK